MVEQVFIGGGFAASTRSSQLTGIDQLLFSAWNLAAQIAEDPMIRAALRLLGEWRVINSPQPLRFIGWVELASSDLSHAVSIGDMPDQINCDEVAWLLIAGFMGVKAMTETLTIIEALQERSVELIFRTLIGYGYQGSITDPVEHVKKLVSAPA